MPKPKPSSARRCARAERGAGVAHVDLRSPSGGHDARWAARGGPVGGLGALVVVARFLVAPLLGECVVGEVHGRVEMERQVAQEVS